MWKWKQPTQKFEVTRQFSMEQIRALLKRLAEKEKK